MSMSEKFCLKWNDFQENVSNAIGSFRSDKDLTDVTLACEDGQQVQAHKIILAASSPFFQNILKLNKHSHPLIYMRGVKAEDLEAIVDFLYHGETNIYQENLDTFLIIAQELNLKGLSGKESNETKEDELENNTKPRLSKQANTPKKESTMSSQISSFTTKHDYPLNQMHVERTVALPKQECSEEMQEQNEKIRSMMVLSGRLAKDGVHKSYICQVCQKEGKVVDIKRHIEAKHIEGLSIPCNFCQKTFRSSNAMRQHICKT